MSKKIGLNLDFKAGVNQFVEPRHIQDNEAVLLRNLFVAKGGSLQKRPGMQCITQALINGLPIGANHNVTGPCRPLNPKIGNFFLQFVGFPDASPPRWDAYILDSTGKDLGITPKSFPYGDNWPEIIDYRGDTLIFTGLTEGFIAITKLVDEIKFYDCSFVIAANATTGAGQSQIVPVQPRHATVYKNRLVLGNFGPGMENWLVVADFQTDTSIDFIPGVQPDGSYVPVACLIGNDALSFNGNHVELESAVSDRIVALEEIFFDMTGTPASAGLLILMENQVWIATGSPLNSFDTVTPPDTWDADFFPKRLNFECGCLSQYGVCRTPFGVFWVGPDDVWYVATGAPAPVRVGAKLRPAIENVPFAYRNRVSAVYCDGFLRIHLPTSFSRIGGRDGVQDILRADHYWLDLRNGPPQSVNDARWYGPMQYSFPSSDGAVDFEAMPGIPFNDRGVTGGKPKVLIPCTVMTGVKSGVTLSDISTESNAPFDFPFPHYDDAVVWQASSPYFIGDIVRPPFPNGRFYVCTTAGTSDPTPSFGNDNDGDTVADGATLVWTEISPYTRAISTKNWAVEQGEDEQYNSPYVTTEIRTKVFDFEDIGVKKLLEGIEIAGKVSNNTNLFITALGNGGAFAQTEFSSQQLTKSFGDFKILNDVINAQTSTQQLGRLVIGTQRLYDAMTVKSIKPITNTNDRRYTAKDFQFSIQDRARYQVVSGFNDRVVLIEVNPAGEIVTGYVQGVPPGEYTSLQSLAETVATAITDMLDIQGISGTCTIANLFAGATSPYHLQFILSIDSVSAPGNVANQYALVMGTLGGPSTPAYGEISGNLFATLGFDTGIALGTASPYYSQNPVSGADSGVRGNMPSFFSVDSISGEVATNCVYTFFNCRNLHYGFSTPLEYHKIMMDFRMLGRRTTTGHQT